MYNDVLEFMEAMGQGGPGKPTVAPEPLKELRKKLIREEVEETFAAMDVGDLVEVADGLADIMYVVLGAGIAYGIDLRPVWAEVQRSNMAKVGGPVREDGKRLKPPGWTPPAIKAIIDEQLYSRRSQGEV